MSLEVHGERASILSPLPAPSYRPLGAVHAPGYSILAHMSPEGQGEVRVATGLAAVTRSESSFGGATVYLPGGGEREGDPLRELHGSGLVPGPHIPLPWFWQCLLLGCPNYLPWMETNQGLKRSGPWS